MRKGKIAAQTAHASLAAISKIRKCYGDNEMIVLDPRASAWFKGPFVKIVVSVDSEYKLKRLYHEAESRGMLCSLIKDAGRTEFNGVPTYTAVAIGPDELSKVDVLTGDLKLL